MKGTVDDQLRALIHVSVSSATDGKRREIVVWIDTAFNGGLVIPKRQIEELGLVQESAAEAILADGQSVELEMYQCFVDWFGATYETQVASNDSEFPLLGTQLLDGHRLDVDYRAKTIELI